MIMTMTELVLRAPINLSKKYLFGSMVLLFWPGGHAPLFQAPTYAHDRPANHSVAGSVKYETQPAPWSIL